jgi:hypothetical protein
LRTNEIYSNKTELGTNAKITSWKVILKYNDLAGLRTYTATFDSSEPFLFREQEDEQWRPPSFVKRLFADIPVQWAVLRGRNPFIR